MRVHRQKLPPPLRWQRMQRSRGAPWNAGASAVQRPAGHDPSYIVSWSHRSRLEGRESCNMEYYFIAQEGLFLNLKCIGGFLVLSHHTTRTSLCLVWLLFELEWHFFLKWDMRGLLERLQHIQMIVYIVIKSLAYMKWNTWIKACTEWIVWQWGLSLAVFLPFFFK